MTIGEWLEEIVAQQAALDDEDTEQVVRENPRLGRSDRQPEPSDVSHGDRPPASSIGNSEKENGIGHTIHSLRTTKRASDLGNATSEALLDRIEALEQRIATFAAGETTGESEANGEHSRTSVFVQAGSSRAKAGHRPPDFRVQNEPTEIEKIKSAVCAMHKLLEVTSRKLVSIEGDVGHMRRFLDGSGSE